MPYPNEHACRLNPPSKYESFGRGTRRHDSKTYSIIFGKPKGEGGTEEQAYRYNRKTWSAQEARAHCNAHGGSFEAATGETKQGIDQLLVLQGPAPAVFLKQRKITGRALHPVVTYTNEFPMIRKFLAEELERAAKDSDLPIPIMEDHELMFDLNVNHIDALRWDPIAMQVYYEGEISEQLAKAIEAGEYKNGVSVELDFPVGSRIDFVDGSGTFPKAVPSGFRFAAVSLLKKYKPSDPTTSVEVWKNAVEGIPSFQKSKIKNGGRELNKEDLAELKNVVKQGIIEGFEAIKLQTDLTDEERAMIHFNLSTEEWNLLTDEEKQDTINRTPSAGTKRGFVEQAKIKSFKLQLAEKYPVHVSENFDEFIKLGGTIEEFKEKQLQHEWTIDAITDLPDSSFALIEENNGVKVLQFPFKDKDGNIVQYQLERSLELWENLGEEVTDEVKDQVSAVLCEAAKEINFACATCGTTTESLLVAARKDLFAAQNEAVQIQEELDDEKKARAEDRTKIVNMLQNIIPVNYVVGSHKPSSGFIRLLEDVKHVKHEIENMET